MQLALLPAASASDPDPLDEMLREPPADNEATIEAMDADEVQRRIMEISAQAAAADEAQRVIMHIAAMRVEASAGSAESESDSTLD